MLDVAWEKNLHVDGKANMAEATGNVQLNTVSPQGMVATAHSQRAQVTLRDKPADPNQKPKPAQGGIAGIGDKLAALNAKDPVLVEFLDNAHLQAMKPDTSGNLAQQFDLEADNIRYEVESQKLIVPTNGRIAFIDLREGKKTNESTEPLSAGGKGTTAMKWSKQLEYDQASERVTIEGDAFFRHEPADTRKAPITMAAQKMTVDLASSSKDDEALGRVGFKKLTADGGVECTMKGIKVLVPGVEYDPVAGMLTAKGDDRVRGQMYDDKNLPTGSFRELRFNLNTEELKLEDVHK